MFSKGRSFTIDPKAIAFGLIIGCFGFFASCSILPGFENNDGNSGHTKADEQEEAIARTEFSDRLLNFFEFAPLHTNQASQFLIHLTDLTDGTPVENAEVTLFVRKPGGQNVGEIKAKVGRVTGIYVAEVSFSEKGKYDIEFRVKNEKLDERMPLKDFEVK